MTIASEAVSVIAVAIAVMVGLVAALFLGWIAAGGRCGLGLHDFRDDEIRHDWQPGWQTSRCVRCGLERYRRFGGSE